jgi:hypothetical protein
LTPELARPRRGFLDAGHWWLDMPGVYLPAAVTADLAVRFLRDEARRAAASA